jgi:hypothetical protein
MRFNFYKDFQREGGKREKAVEALELEMSL